MNIKTYHHQQALTLDSGDILPELHISYQVFGEANADKSNIIWICHALTGNTNPLEWWSGLVGEDRFYDPNEYQIICANVIGSCYGSTYALSTNPKTGNAYYHDFPLVTTNDMARALDILRKSLGIHQIKSLVGGSLGAQVALHWAIENPDLFEHVVLFAGNAQMSPWGIGFNETQRQAILLDPTWPDKNPKAGLTGMKIARQVGMLSYRHYDSYEVKQKDEDARLDDFKANSYQRYQGEKLASRFDAFAYWTLSKAMDSHHVGRNRGGLISALQKVKAKTLSVGIDTDLLFPKTEAQLISRLVKNGHYKEIKSPYGHDAFLIEYEQLNYILKSFYLN